MIVNNSPTGFYGILESVTIHIRKAEKADKFIIVPSEKEIEKKIIEQCKRSWIAALNLSSEYIKKPCKYHEVIISFDKKEGFYEGNSLGIALTLSFLERVLKFYNPTYVIKIKGLTAFTGGTTEEGKVMPCGEGIIKQKVKTAYFSEMSSFVVPKEDENPAREQFLELQKEYPNRNLKLIPVEDIADVLNRRDLVEIKKQKLVVRTGKFVRKNWVSAVVTVLLAILFGYLFVMDWDDNPASYSVDNDLIFIKNKNGKILWTKNVDYPLPEPMKLQILDNLVKIIDINADGINEILLCSQLLKANESGNEHGSILCLNKNAKLIWKFNFTDKVFSKREYIDSVYAIEIIDTLSEYGQKQVALFANNTKTFPSAIFKLDLQTGQRIKGTHWASGFTYESAVKDINNDGVKEIYLVGKDNGFGEHVLWILQTNKITGARPTAESHKILDELEAEMLACVRFPKTDFEKIIAPKQFNMNQSSIVGIEDMDYITVASHFNGYEGIEDFSTAIIYEFNNDLNDVDIFIGDRFRELRDSLVAHGKLSLPYTETREYKKIIKDNLIYYKNGKWVRRTNFEQKLHLML